MSIVDKFFKEGQKYNSPDDVPEGERPPWHPSNKNTYQITVLVKTFASSPTVEDKLEGFLAAKLSEFGMEVQSIDVDRVV